MTKYALVAFAAPLLLLALSVPLIAGKVPRNYLYGVRTPRTLASDANWYAANRFGGVLLALASIVWFAAGIVSPYIAASTEQATNWTLAVGLVSIFAMAVIALFFVRRLPAGS